MSENDKNRKKSFKIKFGGEYQLSHISERTDEHLSSNITYGIVSQNSEKKIHKLFNTNSKSAFYSEKDSFPPSDKLLKKENTINISKKSNLEKKLEIAQTKEIESKPDKKDSNNHIDEMLLTFFLFGSRLSCLVFIFSKIISELGIFVFMIFLFVCIVLNYFASVKILHLKSENKLFNFFFFFQNFCEETTGNIFLFIFIINQIFYCIFILVESTSFLKLNLEYIFANNSLVTEYSYFIILLILTLLSFIFLFSSNFKKMFWIIFYGIITSFIILVGLIFYFYTFKSHLNSKKINLFSWKEETQKIQMIVLMTMPQIDLFSNFSELNIKFKDFHEKFKTSLIIVFFMLFSFFSIFGIFN